METKYLNKEIRVSDYKISLTKQLEENTKRLLEHYQRIHDQNRKVENQKQENYSFVCDWQ